MLTGLPYGFKEAVNGTDALAQALEEHDSIDIVLLDINMKDISGIDVCRAIRSSEQDKKRPLPIIAYTAHAMTDEHDQILSAGFDDVLTKPTLRDDLFNILEKYLQ
jgi:two-component system, cell cycle response regulator DivK